MSVDPEEQSGLTHFVIAQNEVVAAGCKFAKSLENKAFNLRIKVHEGKNVSKIVGWLRGAVARLKTVHDGKPPTTAVPDILQVFQSTSNCQFNHHFQTWENNLKMEQLQKSLPLSNWQLETLKPSSMQPLRNTLKRLRTASGSRLRRNNRDSKLMLLRRKNQRRNHSRTMLQMTRRRRTKERRRRMLILPNFQRMKASRATAHLHASIHLVLVSPMSVNGKVLQNIGTQRRNFGLVKIQTLLQALLLLLLATLLPLVATTLLCAWAGPCDWARALARHKNMLRAHAAAVVGISGGGFKEQLRR